MTLTLTLKFKAMLKYLILNFFHVWYDAESLPSINSTYKTVRSIKDKILCNFNIRS
jgi:hypothetical protein